MPRRPNQTAAIGLAATGALAALLATPSVLKPQEAAPARNAIYVEALGPGFLYSLNYERLLSERTIVRLGGSTFDDPELAYDAGFATLARRLSAGSSGFELGAGGGVLHLRKFLFFETDNPETGLYGILLAAYGTRPTRGGVFFRLAFTPLFSTEGIAPWGGLSLGLTF